MGLEMKPACERCGTPLGWTAQVRICSYECTFCPACSAELLDTCPNCGGLLVARPPRAGASDR